MLRLPYLVDDIAQVSYALKLSAINSYGQHHTCAVAVRSTGDWERGSEGASNKFQKRMEIYESISIYFLVFDIFKLTNP